MRVCFIKTLCLTIVILPTLILNSDVLGTKVSFEMRDKIYQAIRIVEANIFYDVRDNTKIVKVLQEVMEIIIKNKKSKHVKESTCSIKNTCNAEKESKLSNLFYEINEIENFDFTIKNLLEFVESFNFNDFI